MARRVVVVDNHDSFTYLLADYLAVLGAECRVVLSDAVTPREVAALRPDGVVLSPGPGRPEDAGATLQILSALVGRVPILGVCLGHQAITLHFGGDVIHASTPMHGKASEVLHDGEGIYRGVPSPLLVGRYHSLVADPRTLPEALRPAATCRDGQHQVIMGIRHVDAAIDGIQFHPESVLSDHGLVLLNNWLEPL